MPNSRLARVWEVFNGGSGADSMEGGTGNTLDNLLTGNSGKNIINGAAGNDILQGVAGDDSLTDTVGNNIFDGGAGIDTIMAGVGNDLILVTGTSEQVTMKDWYVNVNNHSIANLQVVIEGTTDYNAASSNKLNNKKIEQFNFDGLATKFDQARAANPSLSSWALSSSLLEFYLNSSDTAAFGVAINR